MNANKRPRITPPVQAPPVYRDERTGPSAQTAGAGVENAASGCGNLTGAARQMCYLQRHGLTT